MKARMIKVASLLLAGTFVFGAAYVQNGYTVAAGGSMTAGETVAAGEVMTADDTVRAVSALTAGISSIQSQQIGEAVSAKDSVVSGVTDAMAVCLENIPATAQSASVAETGAVPTAAGQAEMFGYTNLGIAQADGNLNVRKEPGTGAEIIGKMPDNAGCEILEENGDWTKIKSGEVEGYVKSEYLLSGERAVAKAAEVKQTIATVNTTTLYVRETPDTECAIITSMPEGEELEVVEILDGWIEINVDSDKGYVSSDYVDISVQLPKAQTMTEVRYGQGVSDVRVSMVQFATQYVGNPYVWGGTSLTRGADCSGFVLSVFANFGISLPHSSRAQANCGAKISASEAKPGDLFFYGNGRNINHVAIYIGNGQVVHASSPKSGIKISGAYYRNPVKVVRIINS